MGWTNKEAHNRHQNEWLKKRRLAWMEANGPCQICGSVKDPELDHIDPSQKVTNNVWGWAAERRLEELAKCRVLCHNCHLRRHGAEPGGRHGTIYRYVRGCRCEVCVHCKRAHLVRQYQAKKERLSAQLAG